MAASSAVLRFACRALVGGRPPASLPCTLVAEGERLVHQSPMPRGFMAAPRRLYSSECAIQQAELNPKFSTVDRPGPHQNPGHQLEKELEASIERITTKLDKINSNWDEIADKLKQVEEALQEQSKCQMRRRRVLVGGSILTGLGIYGYFFRRRDNINDRE